MLPRIPQLSILLVLLVALAPAAIAYDYGYDPAKAVGNGGDWYMELAQDPTVLTSGSTILGYEYFFDFYTLGESFYMTDIVGLENNKILNSHTSSLDGTDVRTQRWGDPDGNYAAWPTSTGRIFDLWSTDVNEDSGSANAFDFWRTSYDNADVGWTSLGYPGGSTANPHVYSEYVEYSGFGFDVWKAELTGPGQPVHWFYTLFGVSPAEDTIYIPGSSVGVWANPGFGGLVYTLRVVYSEPIVQEEIGWSPGAATAQFPVLGDFTVTPPNPTCLVGDVNCDGYVEIGNDILVAFTNFTGPGSFGMVRSDGDVHGPAEATTDPDGHDGDVDVSDILTIFGAFTGPPPDDADGAGLGAPAAAGDPSIPDLIYDPTTGEVTLDPDGSSIIGYSLQNATNSFLPGNHTPILAGVTTALTSQLEEAALAPGSGSIGLVFPTGLDLAGLQALLTVNQVSRSLGTPLVPFDLIVLSTSGVPVPEPASFWMALPLLGGLAWLLGRGGRCGRVRCEW
ncbi:MAG: hypothetical protein DWQ35_12160 [Planctomycetota bacterium]|nr:MAG: hypothetical protein DWQ35_12160 [Planctomycetota bacterium]REK22905.1 MAG: hypothetical protein DWQ42_16475 [Planctomycetota bacterium]REK37395.1 MAG: hypothetical protein DWQ46_22200 [Planctomycetota bacterium]